VNERKHFSLKSEIAWVVQITLSKNQVDLLEHTNKSIDSHKQLMKFPGAWGLTYSGRRIIKSL
jgi:hypothetical protein